MRKARRILRFMISSLSFDFKRWGRVCSTPPVVPLRKLKLRANHDASSYLVVLSHLAELCHCARLERKTERSKFRSQKDACVPKRVFLQAGLNTVLEALAQTRFVRCWDSFGVIAIGEEPDSKGRRYASRRLTASLTRRYFLDSFCFES